MNDVRKKIMIGMSGGVDSSVAALLLLEQGYEVEGLFMKNWEEDDDEKYCTAAEDLKDAQSVSDQLSIPLHTVNFSTEYWDRVFEYFLTEYKAGRTPNPDVLCNREIKFRAFLEHAQSLGAEAIATGHYAGIDFIDNEYQLLRGKDNSKDQSYFLYMLGQKQLSQSMFPLGEIEKNRVRDIAEQNHFINSRKKDSTGICFIGERKFSDFLSRFLPAQPGDIRSENGSLLGQHSGLMYYTIGQRQGLGIGGRNDASPEPWFVADKHLDSNTLIVVQGGNHPLLLKQNLLADDIHWVAGHAPTALQQGKLVCTAKTRYRQPDQACTVYMENDTALRVEFDEPQRAITPGQSLVLYSDQCCLGGAIIKKGFN